MRLGAQNSVPSDRFGQRHRTRVIARAFTIPLLRRPPFFGRNSGTQRVGPFQFGEPREVSIRGHENTAVLYGERRQVSIRHEVAECLSLNEQALQHGPVPLGRRDDSRARLIQPALHAGDRLIQGQGTLEHAWIRGDPDEGTEHAPSETHGSTAGQLSIPPLPRDLVLRIQLVFGVEQNVGIDQDHRESSPSICAKRSWMLSKFFPALSPSLCGFV